MGLTGATIFYVNYFLVPIYSALLPGADLAWASVFTAVFAIPAYFVYAGLGSSMPRAGGDYLYQSRGLHASVGFTVVMGVWVIGSGAFLATSVLAVFILSGLYPVLLFGGFGAAAAWVSTPTGLVTLGVVISVIAILNGAAGIKWVARIQRYVILPAFLISGITIIYILASTNPTAFHTSFNNYANSLFGTSGLYEKIITGFTASGFSWFQTILLGMVLGDTLVMFSVASAPLLGEIKGANSFKGVWWAYFAGGSATALLFMLPQTYFLQTAIGKPFLQAISEGWLFGSVSMPFTPTFSMMTAMATSSYGLIVLSVLGYIAVGYFLLAYDFTWISRIWLAASIDNTIPRAVGATNHRTHAPLIALILAGLTTIIYIPIEAYIPSGFTIIGNIGIWTSGALPMITALAAMVFPWRQKSIYAQSPIAKYKWLLPVSGAILVVLLAIVLYSYAFYPALEVSLGVTGYSIIALELLGCAVWFFAYRAYQKSKGIEIDLAFREIPAE
jgi:amino acid transporter